MPTPSRSSHGVAAQNEAREDGAHAEAEPSRPPGHEAEQQKEEEEEEQYDPTQDVGVVEGLDDVDEDEEAKEAAYAA